MAIDIRTLIGLILLSSGIIAGSVVLWQTISPFLRRIR